MTGTSKKIPTLFLFLPAVLSLVITFVQISGTNTHSRCTLIPASFICLLCAFLQILVLHLYFPLSRIDQGVSSTTQRNGLLVWILIAIMKIPEILTVLGVLFFCGAVLMEMWHSNETTSVIASTCPAHPRRLIISVIVLLGVLYFSMMAIALVMIRGRRISPDSERDPSHRRTDHGTGSSGHELTPIHPEEESREHSELPSSLQTSADPASPSPQPSSPGSPASTSVPKTAFATGRIDDLWHKKQTSGHKSYGPALPAVIIPCATLASVLFLAIQCLASSFPGLRNSFRGVRAPPSPLSVARTRTCFGPDAGLGVRVAFQPILATRALACFEPNSDVSGLGVRVTTYIQSLTFLLTTAIFVWGGRVSSQDRKSLWKTCRNLLIVGSTLLIAAFAQTATSRQSSFHHALVVLNLSWMLAVNATAICVLPTIDGLIEYKWSDRLLSFWPAHPRHMAFMLFISAHLCLTGAFGIYVWSDPTHGRLNASSERIEAMVIHVVFTPISATSPRLRIASLVLSALATIPIVNVALLTAAVVTITSFINAWIWKPYTFARMYRVMVLVLALVNASFIANTELTVHRNRHLIAHATNASTWILGHVLILAFVLSPILERTVTSFRTVRNRAWGRFKGRDRHVFRRCFSRREEKWSASCQLLRQEIDRVIAKFKDADSEKLTELEEIVSELTTARSLLDLAHKRVENPDSGKDRLVIPPGAQQDIEEILEKISVLCGVRFSDVEDPLSSIIVKTYLDAARDASRAADGSGPDSRR